MPHTIEWAEFALQPHVTESALLAASAAMQREFLNHQAGFIARQTLKLNDGRYADLVTWRDDESAREAMSNAVKSSACMAYFALMQVDASPRTGEPIASHDERSSWGGLEIGMFKARPGVNDAEVQSAAREMAQGLYEGQSGFVEHTLLHNGKGDYIDLLLADNRARAEALCGSWHSTSEPGGYKAACQRYLSLIDPSSVQMTFWSRLRTR